MKKLLLIASFIILYFLFSESLSALTYKMVQCKAMDSLTNKRCTEMTDFPSGLCLIHISNYITSSDSSKIENKTIFKVVLPINFA